MKLVRFAVAGAMLAALAQAPVQAADIINNGFFETGLDGWTVFSNQGTTGVVDNNGQPQVVMFDISGFGTQKSARLRVGDFDGPSVFGGKDIGGGGLSQTVTTGAGRFLFDADYASYNPSIYDNFEGGLFSVLIDDIEYASFNTSHIARGATKRGTFNFEINLTAGNHVVKLQALRDALQSSESPFQYFANVSLSSIATAVPEPDTWAMMIGGFALIGGSMRVRRRQVAMTV